MVKFGKNLTQEKVPRWSDGYVDYDSLKKILGEMINTGVPSRAFGRRAADQSRPPSIASSLGARRSHRQHP